MNDETTRYYEDYVRNILKIPYCNFSDTNNRIVAEIVYALTELYKKFPFFDHVLCCIGNFEDVKEHINLINFSQDKYIEGDNIEVKEFDFNISQSCLYFLTAFAHNNDNGYYICSKKEDHHADYFSITINDLVKKKDISNIPDISTTRIGRFSIYHEFGHLLDIFLHISDSEEFQRIIDGHNIEKEVSNYATNSNKELLAEAFSYYLYIKEKITWGSNELVKEIFELVNNKYIEFISTHSKDKYCFNKRYSLSNTDVKDHCIKFPK